MFAFFAFLPLLRRGAIRLALLIVWSVLGAIRSLLALLLALLRLLSRLTVAAILPLRSVATPFTPAIAVFVAAGTLLAAAVAALTGAVAVAPVPVRSVGAVVASRSLDGGRLNRRLWRGIPREPAEEATEKSRLGSG